MLKNPREDAERLIEAIRDVGTRHLLFELQQHHRHRPLRVLHQRDARSTSILRGRAAENVSVVEKTREFLVLYHVLMGALSRLQWSGLTI